LKKGDLGGFKNLHPERIYGKRYILVAKSFFLSPLTLALSPRWGERGQEERTFEALTKLAIDHICHSEQSEESHDLSNLMRFFGRFTPSE
jgi:hypothetical protein